MSVERELLIAAVEWLQELKYMWADTRYSGDWVLLELIADINKIEQLLAQPEPFKPDWANYRQGVADSKREPLSESEIAFIWGDSDYDVAVVRRIEKAHGV